MGIKMPFIFQIYLHNVATKEKFSKEANFCHFPNLERSVGFYLMFLNCGNIGNDCLFLPMLLNFNEFSR
jgi:hypothetical protein